MRKCKIMIVDDHVIVQEGLKQLLEIGGEYDIVGIASSGVECMQLLETKVNPDIILMDVKMQGVSGIETTRLIKEKYPNIKVVMLTIYKDEHYVTDAINAGANGFVLKNVRREGLINIISHVMNKGAFLDPTVTACILGQVKNNKQSQQNSNLTFRELEILKELVAGNKDEEIANLINISKFTVRSHLKNIFKKLGVNSRSQAVTKAISQNIINLE